MRTAPAHNRIIRQAAQSILKAQGLFQKGSSRTWIDDNGWFLTVVEFQPSGWDQGSYLNVAIHYLWGGQNHISFDFGSREKSFLPFSGDEAHFYTEMVRYAEDAMERVREYRRFRDLSFAKAQILRRSGFASTSKELYNKLMICGLAGDTQAKRYASLLDRETQHSQLGYDMQYRRELTEHILPVASNPTALEAYIKDKIMAQRAFWHGKSSMKRLKPELDL